MRCNWILIIIYIIIIPILLFFNFGQSIQIYTRYGLEYSMADHFVSNSSATFGIFTIMPASIILFFSLIKNDFNSCIVLKQVSRKSLWLKQVYKAVLFAIFITLYITLATYLLGGLLSPEYINWNSESSIFFSSNKVVAINISILMVYISFIMTYSIKILVACILSLWIYWLTNKKLISLIIIIGLGLLEIQSISINIFFRVININYELWVKPFGIIFGIGYGIGLSMILIYLGILTGKRKEFLNE